jgi:hemin uptake protein HemP
MNREHSGHSGPGGRPPAQVRAANGRTDPGPGQGETRIIDSQDLLQRQGSVWIRHQGELYRLQLTRQGKLILTK